MTEHTYAAAGVSLDAAEAIVGRLAAAVRSTRRPGVVDAHGGFAGLFEHEENAIAICTDGVGTKLVLHRQAGTLQAAGIDLVAMCVNDVLCCGAEPLFFLDYVAMRRDDPKLLEAIVSGISDGCVESDMALVGGETAIMPDMYQAEDYDLAGFCVGVVERAKVLDYSTISPGDAVIGVASSGLHSNGFSLVRKIVFDVARLKVSDRVEALGATVGEALLRPTTIYARAVRSVLAHYKVKSVVHGIAHITGGGLFENVERILPANVGISIDRGSWPVSPVFAWLQQLGEVDDEEMFRVFNMGVGLVLIVAPYYAESIQQQLSKVGLLNWVIGRGVEGEATVRWA